MSKMRRSVPSYRNESPSKFMLPAKGFTSDCGGRLTKVSLANGSLRRCNHYDILTFLLTLFNMKVRCIWL